MPIETILVNGRQVKTLRELLRPRLRAVFVGFNPSPKSVDVGHYYQGRQGVWFWNELQKYKIVTNLPVGRQDVAAFEQGIGFADLVRIPTSNSQNLSSNEIRNGALSLIERLNTLGEPRPMIVFRYPDIANRCDESMFLLEGYSISKMPSQFDAPEKKQTAMKLLVKQLSNYGC